MKIQIIEDKRISKSGEINIALFYGDNQVRKRHILFKVKKDNWDFEQKLVKGKTMDDYCLMAF